MKAFVYILALLFTIANGQSPTSTAWIGPKSGSSNDTAASPENWSNGVPDATSIVYINDTFCSTGSCTIKFADDLTIGELHVNSTSSSIYIYIIGARLTVNSVITFGNPNYRIYSYIELTEGGVFEIAEDCVATIYPTNSNYFLNSDDTTDNWLINKGSVTVVGSSVTGTTYDTLYIGYSSSYKLSVDSWGSWEVSDSSVLLRFEEIYVFNIYGGSLHGSWISDTQVSINFYDTDVILQEGSGSDDTTGVEGVSIEYVNFYSSSSQNYYDYTSSPPSILRFNTTGIQVNSSQIGSMNVIFDYPGILSDCNITGYAVINSTALGASAWLYGDNFWNVVLFSAIDAPDFTVQVAAGASVEQNSDIYFFGSVTLINDGIWTVPSGGDIYMDEATYFVNTGLLDLQSYTYVYGSTFPGLSTATVAGNAVNMGTIQFTDGGSFSYYYSETATFRQCPKGIIKFDFSTSPGTVDLPNVQISGYLGAIFPKDFNFYAYGEDIITFSLPADGSWPTGHISDYYYEGPADITLPLSQIVCISKSGTTATVKVYDVDDLDKKLPMCPDAEFTPDLSFIPYAPGVDACSDIPDNLQKLEDTASCPASANCGANTGGPSGGDGPSADGAGYVNAVSLAFLLSLVCLLLKF